MISPLAIPFIAPSRSGRRQRGGDYFAALQRHFLAFLMAAATAISRGSRDGVTSAQDAVVGDGRGDYSLLLGARLRFIF